MGIADIIYEEFNRYRDAKKSKEERENIAQRMIEKVLYHFIYKWDALKKGRDDSFNCRESQLMLVYYFDLILNVAVEVNDTIESKIIDSLRKIAINMKELESIILSLSMDIEKYKNEIDKISEDCSSLIEELKSQKE